MTIPKVNRKFIHKSRNASTSENRNSVEPERQDDNKNK